MKLICTFWLLLFTSLFGFALPNPESESLTSTFGYDERVEASAVYDAAFRYAVDYDLVSAFPADEKQNRTAATSGVFAKCAESFAAKGTTLELNAATTWGRAETLADHFARHGADVGAKTANEYANIASRFFQESQAARLPTRIDSQGVIRVFDPKTGTFGSFNPNGTTRTLFKPSSPTYFDRQPGTLVP
jgi:hypothetical protein